MFDLKQTWKDSADASSPAAKRVQNEISLDPIEALRLGMRMKDLIDQIKLGPQDLKDLGATDEEIDEAAPGYKNHINEIKLGATAAYEQQEQDKKHKDEKKQEENNKQLEHAVYFENAHQWDEHVTTFAGFQGKQMQISNAAKLMLSHKDETIEYGLRKGYFKDQKEGEAFMKDAARYAEITDKAREHHGQMSKSEQAELDDIQKRNEKNKALFDKVVESVDQNGRLKTNGHWIDYLDGCFATNEPKSTESLEKQLKDYEAKNTRKIEMTSQFSQASTGENVKTKESPAIPETPKKIVEFSLNITG